MEYEYEFRRTSDTPEKPSAWTEKDKNKVDISHGGKYICRGWSRERDFFTPTSDEVTIQETVPNKAVVTFQPDWPQIFSGEKITLRCEIQGGGDTDWTYEWRTTSSHIVPTGKEYISSAEYPSGEYRCMGRSDYFLTKWSEAITVSAHRPKAQLRDEKRDIPVGGSVTLTCSVNTAPSSGWKYFWYRGEKNSLYTQGGVLYSNAPISVSVGGVYWCRGGRGEPVYYTEYSDSITVNKKLANKAVVTLQPNWSEIYEGEKITLRCEITDEGDSEWEYEWTTTSSIKPSNQNEHHIRSAYTSHSGTYSCKGRMKSAQQSSTEWSDPITLTVSNTYKPWAILSAVNRDIPVWGSVTLICSVNKASSSSSSSSSSGWKYFWYRDKKTSEALTSQSVLYSNGPIHVSVRGVYWCRGGRGEPVYYTEYSDPVIVNKKIAGRAVVTLQPNWSEIYRGEKITLRCEIQGGGDTAWTYGWTTPNSKRFPTDNAYIIIRATESHSGKYRCMGRRDTYTSTEWSEAITLKVLSYKPRAELTADNRDIPVGGSVTLTCSVITASSSSSSSSSSGWKYFWYRGEKTSEPLTSQDVVFPPSRQISVSVGGVYWCRGGRGEPVYYTEYSYLTVNQKLANKAVVTLQPNWSEIYEGEKITLRCEITDEGDSGWEYEWTTTSSIKPSNQNEHHIRSAYTSHSGTYSCKGRMKSVQQSSKEWSDPITLTVSNNNPQPVLSVSPSWLSPGASVTLNCSVKDPSAGWRFYWYKAVPRLSDISYSYDLLPGSTNGTEQDSYIVDGQTHTAGYVCRAARGDPVFYTYYSEPKFVWSGEFDLSASLTVSPDRVQHFTSESVSLSCEGNSTEWRVKSLPENSYWPYCSSWGTMTRSTCTIQRYRLSAAVFWCESGSGEFSNAVNITIQNEDIILVSPVRPVTEGDFVTLSCELRRQISSSKVFFYRNGEVIQNATRRELNISAVSKSDEGLYKCQHSGTESTQSWMSVKDEEENKCFFSFM
ncbi:Fc receptor-like protein 5 [Perca fluviatilis]|uniref:Fc receptor-like protein 5 n=1 Tax=Perca fluviatilis TaxID=8168 RepID=UPI0019650B5E|nr:Fc receptor-like protein 5 [Perca fluviatilis]